MWVSLTCSPEHTARQCRNFTFPAAAVKWHNCRSYLVPLIIACITLNMYIERCLPACITLSMHIVVHIVAPLEEITWGGCPPPQTPPLNLGGRCPPRPPMANAVLARQPQFSKFEYWSSNLDFPNLSLFQHFEILAVKECWRFKIQ